MNNEDWKHLDDDNEVGWPGLLVLTLVVLTVSWISYCVAAAYLV